jgi:arylsulfatase/arylsulfatase A
VYENGIRVPLFIRWPNKIQGGKKYNNLAAHIDLLPTLIDASKIDPPDSISFDGISLMPLLQGETDSLPDREIYLQGHRGIVPIQYVHFTVRSHRYKLISPHDDPYNTRIQNYRSNADVKQILASLELYDTKADPSEIHNIARQKPEVVEDLLTKYENWFSEVVQEGDFNVPKPTHAGTKFQHTIHLSQFDRNRKLGHWDVRANAGEYRITLHFDKTQKQGIANLRFNGIHAQNIIEQGDTISVFENLSLPDGTGRFEAFLKLDRLSTDVRYIDLERLD